MKLIEDLQVHDSLNPKLWQGTVLREEVKNKIIEIVSNFENYINVPISIVDIQLVGSNASFNYTDTSDLDVHIIANFETVPASEEVLQALYDAKKASFNKEYDIKLRGIPIELYIQDVKSNIVSNGIYSVCEDKWIKEPKPIKSLKNHDVSEQFDKWKAKISEALASESYEEIAETINILYLIRHNSIACDGEYGKGNQLFKELRGAGLLGELKDALTSAASKQLSLESLSEGQIVNRF